MRRVIVFLCLVFLASTTYLSCKAKPESKIDKGEAKIEVVVDIKALKKKEAIWPDKLQVIQPQHVDSKGTIERLSEILRLRGKVEEKEEHFEIVDGTRYLEVSKISPAVFYGEMDRLWTQGPIPGKRMKFEVPDDKSAKEIATELLTSLNFAKTDLRFMTLQSQAKVAEILKSNDKKPTSVVVGRTVTVRRTLNGFPVIGRPPGSKIKVYIEGDGRMAGWLSVWRPFGGAHSYLVTLKSPPRPETKRRLSLDAAVKRLTKNPLEHMLIADVEKVIIKDVELAYYAKSASEKQEYLQPVYAFTGVMQGGRDTKRPFELPYQQYIIAIEKPLEAIWDKGIEHKFEPRKDLKIPVDKDEEVGRP